jgi:hypothetical protein
MPLWNAVPSFGSVVFTNYGLTPLAKSLQPLWLPSAAV